MTLLTPARQKFVSNVIFFLKVGSSSIAHIRILGPKIHTAFSVESTRWQFYKFAIGKPHIKTFKTIVPVSCDINISNKTLPLRTKIAVCVLGLLQYAFKLSMKLTIDQ